MIKNNTNQNYIKINKLNNKFSSSFDNLKQIDKKLEQKIPQNNLYNLAIIKKAQKIGKELEQFIQRNKFMDK